MRQSSFSHSVYLARHYKCVVVCGAVDHRTNTTLTLDDSIRQPLTTCQLILCMIVVGDCCSSSSISQLDVIEAA